MCLCRSDLQETHLTLKSLTKRTTAPYITSPRQTSTLIKINTTLLHNKTEDSQQHHIMQSKNLLSTVLYLKVQQNKANLGLFMASKDLEYSTEATWITFSGAFYNLKPLFSIYWKELCVLYGFMKESTRVRNDYIHFWVNKMYGFSNIKFKVMNWDNITDFVGDPFHFTSLPQKCCNPKATGDMDNLDQIHSNHNWVLEDDGLHFCQHCSRWWECVQSSWND